MGLEPEGGRDETVSMGRGVEDPRKLNVVCKLTTRNDQNRWICNSLQVLHLVYYYYVRGSTLHLRIRTDAHVKAPEKRGCTARVALRSRSLVPCMKERNIEYILKGVSGWVCELKETHAVHSSRGYMCARSPLASPLRCCDSVASVAPSSQFGFF